MIIRNGEPVSESQANKAIIGIGVITFLSVIMIALSAKYEHKK